MAVSLVSTGVTFPDNSTQTTAATGFGFKNRIINGAMVIDQRNAGASVTPTASNTYTVDRWSFGLSQASKLSFQQNAGGLTGTDLPTGFTNYLGVTTASAYTPSAGETFILQQRIEGFNVADFAWGTANAQTITVSFKVRTSIAGTYGASIRNSGGNRSYPFSFTVNSANTWEDKSVTIAGDTSGTWLTTNGIGLILNFSLGAGSSFKGTAGAWTAGNIVSVTGAVDPITTGSATFYITGVQLEKGSTATGFDYRPYGTELALCQRYCVNYRSAESGSPYLRYGIGASINTTQIENFFSYPVPMRVIPTLTTTGTASNYGVYESNAVTACSAVPTLNNSSSNLISLINAVVASGLTVGRGASLLSNNNNTSYLLFSAEL